MRNTLFNTLKVVSIVYSPVWIDLMAPASSKAMWIAFYYMTVPLGVVLGFILSPLTVSVFKLGF
jgi:hypothetical protein